MLQSQEEGPYFTSSAYYHRSNPVEGEKWLLNSWVLKVSTKGVSKILSLFGKSRLGIGKKYKSEIIFTGELVMIMALTSLSESVLNLPGPFVLLLPTLPLLVGIL